MSYEGPPLTDKAREWAKGEAGEGFVEVNGEMIQIRSILNLLERGLSDDRGKMANILNEECQSDEAWAAKEKSKELVEVEEKSEEE